MALYNPNRAPYDVSMFSSGVATIFVTDMDRSIHFYTEVLGLGLTQRFGNHWAQVEAGRLTIGLHPASAENSAGRDGSITVGFVLSTKIEDAVSTLQQKGVKFRGPISLEPNAGKFAYFEDPDGNVLYMMEIVAWPQSSSTGAREFQSVR
jgi:catechol 2,3-dioxygenase-like lactoylglutathione lyase family enzyme